MRLQISPLISDGMVFQWGISVPIDGSAPPGADIAVSFLGKVYRTRADNEGRWRLFLDSQAPGGPHIIEVSLELSPNPPETITINDVYAGDVWICSGQSNMELPMQRLRDNYPEEWKSTVNLPGGKAPAIRQFKVPQDYDFSGPRQLLAGGCWTAASPEILHEFSGTAWFFAKAIYKKHRIPLGLINASWGGTPAEAWMSADGLAAFPEKRALGNRYADPELCEKTAREAETALKAWADKLAALDSGLTVPGGNARSAAWYEPQIDLSQWREITLPCDFAEAGLTAFCGVIWLRREFEAPANFAAHDAQVWLGTIVDADTVYINGVEVGNTTYRYPPRKYPVPAGLLHEGKNTIVIRVVCNNGEGGITRDKPFRIFSKKGSIELAGDFKYRIGAIVEPRPEEFFFQRLPMCLFNAMIAPILKYPCKGVIWYQGESNDKAPHEYASLFTALINDWREKSKSLLPFLFVQLPIWGPPEDDAESSSWAVIREAQCSALSLPMTGMAVGLDLGEWNDLHPLNKKDIGLRLALAAEKVVYGQRNTAPGPLLRSVERKGSKVILRFDNCGAGIKVEEDLTRRHRGTEKKKSFFSSILITFVPLCLSVRLFLKTSFYLSVAAKGRVYRLPAKIEGRDCISVDVSSIRENPERVLYAWANNPRDRQLYNSDGLPVIPFRAEI